MTLPLKKSCTKKDAKKIANKLRKIKLAECIKGYLLLNK